jgi:hypothetical protein
MNKSQGSWKGKPIEDYSKDELIEIIVQLAKEINSIRDRHRLDLDKLTIGLQRLQN